MFPIQNKTTGWSYQENCKKKEHKKNHTLIFCLVVIASFVWNAMFMSILPNPKIIATMAGARTSTVKYVLNWQVCWRPRSFTFDVYPVGQSTGRSHRPTWPTVYTNIQLLYSMCNNMPFLDYSKVSPNRQCIVFRCCYILN